MDEELTEKEFPKLWGYTWASCGSANDEEQEYTFVITTPTNDRITVKAVDFEVDDGCLYFFDDNDIGIYALATGHWIKVERQE